MTEEFNGWRNWSTWNMNLWLTNDEPTYRIIERQAIFYRDTFKEELDTNGTALSPEAIPFFAQWLKTKFGFPTPDMKGDDLIEVNWEDIAEAWL